MSTPVTRRTLVALLLAPFLAACPPAQELDAALVARSPSSAD
jgi:hypothetical protein